MELKLAIKELLEARQEISEILAQNLEYSQKFTLLDLEDVINDAVSNYEKVREDMIKELGVENPENGTFAIQIYENPETKDRLSDNYVKFQEQLAKIFVQEKDVVFTPISVDSLKGVKTSSSGRALRKFIVK